TNIWLYDAELSEITDNRYYSQLSIILEEGMYYAKIEELQNISLITTYTLVLTIDIVPLTCTVRLQRFGFGPLDCAAYSPDGKKILTGGDSGAYLWDLETGGLIRQFGRKGHSVTCIAFSPDGTKILTGSQFITSAKLWDVNTGVEIQTFALGMGIIESVAFSPDGTKLLTASNIKSAPNSLYTANLWDINTGEEIQSFLGHEFDVKSAAFSPDGSKVLTGSYDKTAMLWNANTGEAIHTFSGHST
ncbi:unnamed protein product, partial [marine sediment metagenome]